MKKRGYFVDVNGMVCTFEDGKHNCNYGIGGYIIENDGNHDMILLLDEFDGEGNCVIDEHVVHWTLKELAKVMED